MDVVTLRIYSNKLSIYVLCLKHIEHATQADYDSGLYQWAKLFSATTWEELTGDFCRGCGYCMPCPAGITINQCARMSLMLRRAPSAGWLSEKWQEEMKKIENCLECGQCRSKCPYELNTPELLKKNYEDYKKVLAGEVSVE